MDKRVNSPCPKKKRSSKKKAKKVKVPIQYDEKHEDHVKLAPQVETQNYVAEEEHNEDEEAKYEKKRAEIKQKFWDEIEMKSHGLVDKKAHHIDHELEKPQKAIISHIPFDEVEMKHSGYVDDHGHHLTQGELTNDHGEENEKKHIQFAAALVSPSSCNSIEEVSIAEVAPISSDQKSQQLKVEPQVEKVEIERDEEEYNEKHLPWDELELKEHWLVDNQGRYKRLPEDDFQLHREGKVDEHGNRNPTYNKAKLAHHLPFDEVAMKKSGYVDDHCHHMTVGELTKEKTPSSSEQRRVEIKSLKSQNGSSNGSCQSASCKSPSSGNMPITFATPLSSLADKKYEQEKEKKNFAGSSKTKRKLKTIRPKGKRILRVKVAGVLNIIEKIPNQGKL